MNPQELIDYTGADRIVHFTEYLKIKESDKRRVQTYRSGFSSVDEKLDGLCTTELTVISGKTGEGKTLFAESWMRGLLDKNPDLKACLFSFEVTPRALLEKYASSPQLKLYLPLELKTADFSWLQDRVLEAAVKENCRLFVFDHLHFLIDMAEKQNMSLNIGRFMRELKGKVAMALNVSVVLIAHQAKSDNRGSKREEEPSIDNVRDSTFITQEADNVILVWRRQNFTGKELQNIVLSNPMAYARIKARMKNADNADDKYSDQFAVVQIAKSRRSGAFRWKKLFQKSGPWLEEI